MDDLSDDDGGPLLWWYRFSMRHPRWRVAITSLAVALLIALFVAKIAREDTATLWVPILGLVLWGIDIAVPRPVLSRRADTPM